ncbi:MAG: VIT family protein [Micromonosporaceae bacterium]|nr:VIT family protein [Micromonosporaceae bacterium]
MTDRAGRWHRAEPHHADLGKRTNWLRAAVLGANDGIVSVAGLVVGVAGASGDRTVLLTAGLAGMAAGALSMGAGEYVSVSTQRDTERALLDLERRELVEDPEAERQELAAIYQAKGLTPELARQVADQLSEVDAFSAHAEAELGIDPRALVNPWAAAGASVAAFTLGAALPLAAIVAPPASVRVPVTMAAVLLALALTGSISARLGGSHRGRAVARVVGGGALAMAITYAIGTLVGAAV